MSCVLRITGEVLHVDAVVSLMTVPPYRTWNKGEPRARSIPNGRVYEDFGVVYDISLAEMDQFPLQIKDATAFLVKHREELRLVAKVPGVQSMNLDFGVELRDTPIHSDVLPHSFLVAAADTAISVELSHYPCSIEAE